MSLRETYCASCPRCGEPFQFCECWKSPAQLAREREQRYRAWRRIALGLLVFWIFVAWCVWGRA